MGQSRALDDCGIMSTALSSFALDLVDGLPASEQTSHAILWHVLYVKSRQEKALADDLTEMEIGHYLPLVNSIRFYGRRSYRVSVPLLPGYLFLKGSREQLYKGMCTRRVVRAIDVADQDQIEWELSNIKLALDRNAELRPHPMLGKGCRVEVRSGPFKGVQGLIENAVKIDRIVLQIDMLGRALSMEIDGRLLDLLPAL